MLKVDNGPDLTRDDWGVFAIRNAVHLKDVTVLSDDCVGLTRISLLGNHKRLEKSRILAIMKDLKRAEF